MLPLLVELIASRHFRIRVGYHRVFFKETAEAVTIHRVADRSLPLTPRIASDNWHHRVRVGARAIRFTANGLRSILPRPVRQPFMFQYQDRLRADTVGQGRP